MKTFLILLLTSISIATFAQDSLKYDYAVLRNDKVYSKENEYGNWAIYYSNGKVEKLEDVGTVTTAEYYVILFQWFDNLNSKGYEFVNSTTDRYITSFYFKRSKRK